MRRILVTPLLVILAGCEGSQVSFEGITTWDMFPFDGDRTWEYRSTDRKLDYELVARITGKPDIENSINVYTLSYTETCVNDDPKCNDFERFRIRWSSTPSRGVFVHTIIDNTAGSQVNLQFEPPLQVADTRMERGEVIETVTGGRTWTSTFGGLVACDVNFSGWNECGEFTIESTSDAPSPILGKWLFAVGNGAATIDFADEEGVWRLSDAECGGDCDGRWY